MRRLSCLVVLGLLSLCGSNVSGKNYWYDSLTPGTSAAILGTSTFSSSVYDKYEDTDTYGGITASYYIETFTVRVRYDGTAPTLTEGVLLYPGDMLVLAAIEDIRNLKIMGTGGTATVKVVYEENHK